MPFVAPTFAQSFAPGTAAGDANTAAGGPQSAAQADALDDKKLLASIQRPDWVVVAKSPIGADHTSTWQLAGPNGQTDTMDVGADGTIVALPKKTPAKPTAADVPPSDPKDWVPIVGPDGTPIAMQDPKHAGSRVDIPKPPAARVDTPADTSNAATNAGRLTVEQGNAAEAKRKNQADEDIQKAQLALATSNANFDHVHQQAQDDLAAGRLTLDQYQAKVQEAHDQRMDAQAAVNSANQRLRDINDANFQQGQLQNQQTQNQNQQSQNAESTRHNTATETETASNNQTNQQLSAAILLQNQQKNDQAAQDAAATRSETLLKDRATLATGVNNSLFNAAAGAKNYGLGSSADVSGLPSASQAWATGMMGGQPLFDQAVKMVHDANPALSNTPQGAAYTSLLEQVLQKKAQVQAGGLTTPGTDSNSNTTSTSTTSALAPPGVAGTVSPSDPRYLGAVIGHATSTALGNMQLSPDSQFTAPGAAV